MNQIFSIIPRLLRDPESFYKSIERGKDIRSNTYALMLSSVFFLLAYGFVIGLPHSIFQALSSAIKMPLLFLVTMIFCLPALYFFSLALLGTSLTILQITAIVLSGIGVTAFLLLGLSPITLFFDLTSNNYPFFKVLTVIFVTVSGCIGLYYLWRGMIRVDKDKELTMGKIGRTLLGTWILLYGFVGAQMTWRLSPFIGDPEVPFVLLRPSRDNFFIDVFRAFGEAIGYTPSTSAVSVTPTVLPAAELMYPKTDLSFVNIPTQFTNFSPKLFTEMGDRLQLDDPRGSLQVEGKFAFLREGEIYELVAGLLLLSSPLLEYDNFETLSTELSALTVGLMAPHLPGGDFLTDTGQADDPIYIGDFRTRQAFISEGYPVAGIIDGSIVLMETDPVSYSWDILIFQRGALLAILVHHYGENDHPILSMDEIASEMDERIVEMLLDVSTISTGPAFKPYLITPLHGGFVSLADYDADGNLDLLSGCLATDTTAYIFRNYPPGIFTEVQNLPCGHNIHGNSQPWVDYDQDGDLDLALPGRDESFMYRNEEGVFLLDERTLLPIQYSGGSWFQWGDIDGINGPDLVLVGVDNSGLYVNDGSGVLTQVQELPKRDNHSGDLGDYDLDGDLDLVVIGARPGGGTNINRFHLEIFRNDNGVFTLIDDLTNRGGDVRWVDYDQDGLLDIFIAGSVSSTINHVELWRQGPIGTFVRDRHQPALKAFQLLNPPARNEGVSAWGDYDGDGDLDLYLSSPVSEECASMTFQNEPTGTMVADLGPRLHNFSSCNWYPVWADIDNDGDMDLIAVDEGRIRAFENMLEQ